MAGNPAVLHTEYEQHLRIQESSARTPSGEPCEYIVTDKLGTLYHLGGRPLLDDSATCQGFSTAGLIYASSVGRPAIWLLTSIVDRFGNQIEFQYAGPTPGECDYPRLSAIKWGGNVTANKLATYQLDFTWQSRPVIEYAVQSGIVLRFAHRLAKTTLSVLPLGGAPFAVRDWEFSYTQLPDTRQSFLSSIRVKDPGSSAALPPTTFSTDVPDANPFVLWNEPVNDNGKLGAFGYTVATPDGLYRKKMGYKRTINTHLDIASKIPNPYVQYSALATKLAFNYFYRPKVSFWTTRETSGLMDMNGDGRPDRVASRKQPGFGLQPNCIYVALNTGSGFGEWTEWGKCFDYLHEVIVVEGANGFPIESQVKQTMLDFNGDGLPDIIECDGDAWNVSLNDGSRFVAGGRWAGVPCTKKGSQGGSIGLGYSTYGDEIALAIDVNGDGWLDFVECAGEEVLEGISTKCRAYINLGRNDGSSAFRKVNFNSPFPLLRARRNSDHYWITTAMMVDLNGDGLPDLVYQDRSGTECLNYNPCPRKPWYVYLNRGGQLESAPRFWPGVDDPIAEEWLDRDNPMEKSGLADFNGDGLPDYFSPDSRACSDSRIRGRVAFNTGGGFTTDACLELNALQTTILDSRGAVIYEQSLFDVDGDGIVERVVIYDYDGDGSANEWIITQLIPKRNGVAVAGVEFPHLIRRVTYPLGGDTRISYVASSSGAMNTRLPSVVPLAKSFTSRAMSRWSPDEAHTMEFTYGDGRLYRSWDTLLSLGFGWSKALDLSSKEYQRITYNQYQTGAFGRIVPSNVGTVKAQEVGRQIGTMEHKLRTVERTYQIDLDPPYDTPLVITATADYNYQTTPVSFRSNAVLLNYDAYGNVTQRTNTGDPNVDRNTSEYVVDFHYDVANWVVALPKTARVFDNFDGARVLRSETRYFYDGRNSLDVLPTKGFVSRVTSGDPDNTITPDIPNDFATIFYNHAPQSGGGTIVCVGGANGPLNIAYQEDPYGRVTDVIDPLCNRQTIAYDSQYPGFVLVTTNGSRPVTTRYGYYGVAGEPNVGGVFGAVKWVQDPNGEGKPNPPEYRTTFKYDPFGRLTEFARPYDAWTEQFEYRSFQPIRSSAPYVKRTQRAPTARQVKRTSQVDLDGFARPMLGAYQNESRLTFIKILYDSQGRIRGQSSPSDWPIPDSRMTRYNYDALGRPTFIDRPDGRGPRVSRTSYDGWQITVTGARAYETMDKADDVAFRTVISAIDGKKIAVRSGDTITRYTSDVRGNVVNVQVATPRPCSPCTLTQLNAEDILYSIGVRYDALGRPRSIDHPDLGLITYDLDAAGNVLALTTGRGTIRYGGYDSLNRVGWKSLDGDDIPEVTYSYDDPAVNGVGRLTRITGPGSVNVSHAYDRRGRVVRETLSGADIPQTGSLSAQYRYDSADRLTGLSSNGIQVTYTYNIHGKVETISGGTLAAPLTIVSNADYNAAGKVKDIAYGNELVTHFDYDPKNDNLTSLTIKRGATLLRKFMYEYDDAGNLTRQSVEDSGSVVSDFTYDEQDRLTQKSTSAGGSSGVVESYAYDAKNNIASKSGRAFHYDQRQTTCTAAESRGGPNALSHADGIGDFCYDASGNLVRGAGRSYEWTPEDAPRHIADAIRGTQTRLDYRGDGARYSKVEESLGGASRFAWYGPANFVRSKTGEGGAVVDRLPVFLAGFRVAEIDARGRVLSLHFDHLGSTNLVSSSTGSVLERISYDSYGAIVEDSAPGISNYKYTGQEFDSGAQLHNYGARLYDPQIARFISADSMIANPGDPRSLNPYTYALNNPLRYTDPTGHQGEDVAVEAAEEGSVMTTYAGGQVYFEGSLGELHIYGSLWKTPEDAFTSYIAGNIPPQLAYDIDLPYLTSVQLADVAVSLGYIPRNRNELDLMGGPNARAGQALGRGSLAITMMFIPLPIELPGIAALPMRWLGSAVSRFKALRIIRTAYVDAVEGLGRAVPEGTSALSVEQMARRLVMARNYLKAEARERMPWALKHATNLWDRYFRAGTVTADSLLEKKTALEVIESITHTNQGVNSLLFVQ